MKLLRLVVRWCLFLFVSISMISHGLYQLFLRERPEGSSVGLVWGAICLAVGVVGAVTLLPFVWRGENENHEDTKR